MAGCDGGRQVEGLLVEEIDGELLVVNGATGEAHALNGASAVVFGLCDGTTARAEMADLVAARTGLPADHEIVDLALTELVDAGLITVDEAVTKTSRRQMLQRLGLAAGAAAALPIVETITMRPAAAQGSAPPPPTGDIDCVYHVDNWGPCSTSCGGGTSAGTPIIDIPASGNGQPCPTGPVFRPCSPNPCPVNCVGSWSAFSPCSKTCGGGVQTRTFTVTTPAANGGAPCPAADGATESQQCNADPCP